MFDIITSIIPWDWMLTALAGLGLAVGAYLKGRSDVRRQVDARAAKATIKTLKEVRLHERDAETQDDPALIDRLTRR